IEVAPWINRSSHSSVFTLEQGSFRRHLDGLACLSHFQRHVQSDNGSHRDPDIVTRRFLETSFLYFQSIYPGAQVRDVVDTGGCCDRARIYSCLNVSGGHLRRRNDTSGWICNNTADAAQISLAEQKSWQDQQRD